MKPTTFAEIADQFSAFDDIFVLMWTQAKTNKHRLSTRKNAISKKAKNDELKGVV